MSLSDPVQSADELLHPDRYQKKVEIARAEGDLSEAMKWMVKWSEAANEYAEHGGYETLEGAIQCVLCDETSETPEGHERHMGEVHGY